jgi:hypothetical protein
LISHCFSNPKLPPGLKANSGNGDFKNSYLGNRAITPIIDGTERPVQRPSDVTEQRDQYSGKKKHTLKNNLIVDIEQRLVRYLNPITPT